MEKPSFLLAQTHQCHDSLSAEAFALLDACKLIANDGIKNAIFEANSLNAISYIQSAAGVSQWTANLIIEDIKKYWHLWPKWRLKFVARNADFAAHNLAKWAATSNWEGLVPPDSLPVKCFCDFGFPLVDSSF